MMAGKRWAIIAIALMGLPFWLIAGGMEDPGNLNCRYDDPIVPVNFDQLAYAVEDLLNENGPAKRLYVFGTTLPEAA